MYYCNAIDPVTSLCQEWIELSPFWVELSQMTYDDAKTILSYTASIFALAWLWKRLSLFASRN